MNYRDLTFSKLLVALLLCVVSLNGFGQHKIKTIGNKPRTGSANSSFSAVKGNQVGIEINAGRKPVQLMQLSFHTKNDSNDSVLVKVNVYKMDGKKPGKINLVTADVKGFIKCCNAGTVQLNTIDLSAYDIKVSGDILVAIEFLETKNDSNISFACGLFNGGSFYKKADNVTWKKIPVVGADFSVQVRKN